MHNTLVFLVGLIAVAAAQSCGQTPIQPNLFIGAAFAPVNNNVSQAVTGGQNVNAYSWPWTVAICTYDFWGNCNFQVAGSVIGSQWILTSASYVRGSTRISDYRVQAGVFDESNKRVILQISLFVPYRKEANEQFMNVQAIYIHPQYDGSHNDIALLQLSYPLRFDQFTQPVCLPAADYNQISAGQYQWFTGWGYTTDFQFGNPTKTLQQAQLYIDPLSVCANYYRDSIWDSQLCVGTQQKTACNYDLGGPLVQQDNTGTWYQYGISSYRAKNCDAASVFTRVNSFCQWIYQYTGIQCK
ncbi:hypothetical protein PRIPAC_83724 [Pristionchus pacificus]|uniref:Trypsin n=1 Tax=Pristionchus pacificus TaxID=54126 RepID=A0A454XVN9_PRIPA|nr:hypothetical protein PRIPAC_83724 [Pristionchus pacificus]|eukprot:PDM69790.1 Trypsin [Pristionchus pacificus]